MSARVSRIGFPVLTVALAFAIGGLVVLLTGSNPITVYKSLWVGAGFDWPFQYLPGNPFGVNGALSEFNLIATLVSFTPLVLTGLAVAFAFRTGLFNIGGQGQYFAGWITPQTPAYCVSGASVCDVGVFDVGSTNGPLRLNRYWPR